MSTPRLVNKVFLAIHIADPTHYIDIKSDLWHDILNRGLTHYPSDNEPIHMMPEEIVKISSLMESSQYGSLKNAITIMKIIVNNNSYEFII